MDSGGTARPARRIVEGHIAMDRHDTDEAPIRIGKIEIRYLVDGSHTRQPGMFEMTLPPACNVPPPHSHKQSDELVYVLEGRLRHVMDGVVRHLNAGDTIFTPRGSVHAFSNPFCEPVRTLTVLTPDIGAAYFLDAAEVVNAGDPPDRDRLKKVMRRYGLTMPRAAAYV
jgi:quercetin dioxygenase-like cupin family protein